MVATSEATVEFDGVAGDEPAPSITELIAEERALTGVDAGGTRQEEPARVIPQELGYDSESEMLATVRSRFSIPDSHDVRLVHDTRDGKPMISILVEPKSKR